MSTIDQSSVFLMISYPFFLCPSIQILNNNILISVMSLQTLKFEQLDEGKIIRITISRPKSLNAMNMPFFIEIRDTFKRINTLPNARVVILQAEGKHFTAGLDLKQMASIFSPGESEDVSRDAVKIYYKIRELQEPFMCIYQCRVPVLVGVHGLCIGGGIDLICTTDIRFCTKDAQFNIKEIDIGMAADLGTLQIFPRRVGNESTFRDLAYTGRNMASEEALRIGLVSRVFEDKAQLDAGLLQSARVIASKSPVGVHTIKQVIKRGESKQIYEGLQYIARTNSVMLQTKDTLQAIGAFMQKRKPEFSKL